MGDSAGHSAKIDRLQQALWNEKGAPDILPYEEVVMISLMDALLMGEDRVQKLDKLKVIVRLSSMFFTSHRILIIG